jgi:hypothetical protein
MSRSAVRPDAPRGRRAVGLALVPGVNHASTLDRLERLADAALYPAKRHGRNRVELAEPAAVNPTAELHGSDYSTPAGLSKAPAARPSTAALADRCLLGSGGSGGADQGVIME